MDIRTMIKSIQNTMEPKNNMNQRIRLAFASLAAFYIFRTPAFTDTHVDCVDNTALIQKTGTEAEGIEGPAGHIVKKTPDVLNFNTGIVRKKPGN